MAIASSLHRYHARLGAEPAAAASQPHRGSQPRGALRSLAHVKLGSQRAASPCTAICGSLARSRAAISREKRGKGGGLARLGTRLIVWRLAQASCRSYQHVLAPESEWIVRNKT